MKLEKERSMAMVFARVGHRVVMLEEIPGVSSPDVLIDGTPAELKSVKGHNNIVHYAKEAIRKQQAELVLIEFDVVNERTQKEIRKL
jgi:hypothetical protein